MSGLPPDVCCADGPWCEHTGRLEPPRDRVYVEFAEHSVPVSVVGEQCGVRRCSRMAAHKVGDQSGPAALHELTNYLCCNCMRRIGLDCDRYGTH